MHSLRFTLFFITFFSMIIFSHAQNFNGGMMLGGVASQISGDDYTGYDKPGVTTGIFTGLALKNDFDLRMELNYIQKGSFKPRKPDIGDLSYYKLNLHYVEVPVLLQYSFKQFIFEAGLAWGTLLGYSEENGYGHVSTGREFSKFEISHIFGANYRVGNRSLVNFRFVNSTLPIREHAGGATYLLNMGQYNALLSLSLYYFLKK